MNTNTQAILAARRARAQNDAALAQAQAMQLPEYVALEKRVRALSYEASVDESRLPDYRKACAERDALLARHGLVVEPQYTCKLCSDTGLVDGAPCPCVRALNVQEIRSRFGISVDPAITFGAADFTLFGEGEARARILYRKLEDFCNKFDRTKVNNIVLSGKVGTGKTHLAYCIYNALSAKGYSCVCCTAFGLNNLFFENHTSLDKSSLLATLTRADLLVIDDLGTEPVYRNVTREYLYSLLNERLLYKRRSVITTNLSQTEIFDRYGERIASRLNDKSRNVFLQLEGNDLRLLKK